MASYSFHIRKSDHQDTHGNFDLHVHIYKNEFRKRKLLGRYRLPGLEPVFPSEPELNQTQIRELAGWLNEPQQIRKLQNCLEDTVFNIHELARVSTVFGNIEPDRGQTYINIRIPIAERIEK